MLRCCARSTIANPVCTTCSLPESLRSIRLASASSFGFPSNSASIATTVSAAMMTGGPPGSASIALRRAKSSASAAGSPSSATASSSKRERMTVTASPKSSNNCRRRGEREASETADSRLLIALTADLDESGSMAEARIAVRPVQNRPARIEVQFPFHHGRVAAVQRRALRDGHVVRDEKRQATAVSPQIQNKALVHPVRTLLHRQHLRDRARDDHFSAAMSAFDVAQRRGVVGSLWARAGPEHQRAQNASQFAHRMLAPAACVCCACAGTSKSNRWSNGSRRAAKRAALPLTSTTAGRAKRL